MNIQKKIKEKEELYQQKIEQLQKMQENFQQVRTEAINLEGQITALKEMQNESKKDDE
jgi:methylthioribose-1-phosphate isomerase